MYVYILGIMLVVNFLNKVTTLKTGSMESNQCGYLIQGISGNNLICFKDGNRLVMASDSEKTVSTRVTVSFLGWRGQRGRGGVWISGWRHSLRGEGRLIAPDAVMAAPAAAQSGVDYPSAGNGALGGFRTFLSQGGGAVAV